MKERSMASKQALSALAVTFITACSKPSEKNALSKSVGVISEPTSVTETQVPASSSTPVPTPTATPTDEPESTPSQTQREELLAVINEDIEDYMWLLNAEIYGFADAAIAGDIPESDFFDVALLIIRSIEARRHKRMNYLTSEDGQYIRPLLEAGGQYPPCIWLRSYEDTCTWMSPERQQLYNQALYRYFVEEDIGPYQEIYIDSYHSIAEKGCAPYPQALYFYSEEIRQFICFYKGLWYAVEPTVAPPDAVPPTSTPARF